MLKFEATTQIEEFEALEKEIKNIELAIVNFKKEILDFNSDALFKRQIASTIKKSEINAFIEDNFNKRITEILEYLNKKLVPFLFKLHLYKAIVKTKEFNIRPYFLFLEEVDLSNDFVKVFINKNNELDIEVNPKKVDLEYYSTAIKKTRAFFRVGKLPPQMASEKWGLYYGAARLGLIVKKVKKVHVPGEGEKEIEEDLTAEFADRYWRTVEERVYFFPNNTIPFFNILQYGNKNLRLSSNRGGYPYPAFSGYNILGNVLKDVKRELVNIKRAYKEYIFRIFPTVEIELDTEGIDQNELRKAFIDLLNKGVIAERKKRLLNFKKMYPATIINSVKEYIQKLGYPNAKVEVFKTKGDTFSIRVRMPDGKFVKWRVL